MASRIGRVLFQLSRPNLRATGQNAGRRMMSSHSDPAQSNDRTWQIGAALIFGPTILYLLSPKGKSKAHEAEERAQPKITKFPVVIPEATLPVKDDEGTEVSAESVQASAQDALNTDSPNDAQEAEEKTAGSTPTLTDAEGETASASEVDASISQASKADSPTDAKTAEESADEVPSGEPAETHKV